VTGIYTYYDVGTYLIYVVPAIIISIIAQIKVSSAFKTYSNIRNSRGITGCEAAQQILRAAGIHDVTVQSVSGNLTDHYDPKAKVIRLSGGVYGASTVASVGIAAHEAGHAVQHHIGYKPLVLRNASYPLTRIASTAAIPLIIIGFVLSLMPIVWIGIIFFSATLLFQLITLPVEFNASRRALLLLDEGGVLTRDELGGAKKVLSAAAFTYVAAMLVSLMQLLRFVVLARGQRRD